MASPTRSVANAKGTRRLVKIWSSNMSLPSLNLVCPDTEGSVVDSVPASWRWVRLTVAPPMPAIPPTKKAAVKGKTVPHCVTRPRAHKVMWVISPSPELAGVSGPNPLIAGPSGVTQPPLFEELLQSGGDEVRPVAQGSSSEWDQSHPFWYSADAFQFSGPCYVP